MAYLKEVHAEVNSCHLCVQFSGNPHEFRLRLMRFLFYLNTNSNSLFSSLQNLCVPLLLLPILQDFASAQITNGSLGTPCDTAQGKYLHRPDQAVNSAMRIVHCPRDTKLALSDRKI